MPASKRRMVYSTEPEPENSSSKVEEGAPRNPAAPFARQGNNPVRVQRERKGRRGKTVCLITGVLSPQAGQRALLKHLKSQLGTGGALKDGVIEIQGDQRERIIELLTKLGYQAKAAGG